MKTDPRNAAPINRVAKERLLKAGEDPTGGLPYALQLAMWGLEQEKEEGLVDPRDREMLELLVGNLVSKPGQRVTAWIQRYVDPASLSQDPAEAAQIVLEGMKMGVMEETDWSPPVPIRSLNV